MIIKETASVPDTTYFRVGDAAPYVQDGAIYIRNGKGTARSSWGAPGVTSTVVVNTDDLAAIHVGFYHKHGGGQFWRYFRYRDGEIVRERWSGLSDDERLMVLRGWGDRAPSWAKRPGKLRKDRVRPGELEHTERLPDGRLVGYKVLLRRNGNFYSPIVGHHPRWDGGELYADFPPSDANRNGIYATK